MGFHFSPFLSISPPPPLSFPPASTVPTTASSLPGHQHRFTLTHTTVPTTVPTTYPPPHLVCLLHSSLHRHTPSTISDHRPSPYMADSNVVRGVTRTKHTWTNDEDAKLIDALMELHASGKYAGADNGFKPGYLNGVQQLLDVSLPNSGIKAEPHIKSRMKTWKTHFSIVYDMVHTSGFGWDEQKSCVIADDSVWDEYVKSHKGAANFRDKPFPFYDKLCTIFGKDRATGSKAVDLGEEDVVQETQRSSPDDIEDFDFVEEVVPNVLRPEGPTGGVTSRRKRGRSTDADEIYRESCKEMKEVLLQFGEMVGEQLNKEGIEANEIYQKVSDEMKALPGITRNKRLKAAHLIGKDVALGRLFLASTTEDKFGLVELFTDGSMG